MHEPHSEVCISWVLWSVVLRLPSSHHHFHCSVNFTLFHYLVCCELLNKCHSVCVYKRDSGDNLGEEAW